MANEEEKVLESELESQLKEERESLAAIEEAIFSDPSNPDLLSVQEELLEAIKHAEEGLFHLKRARLLREADSVLETSHSDSADAVAKEADVQPLRQQQQQQEEEESNYHVGSKCRFPYTDGRWYNGQVIELEASTDTAKVSFLTPTSENMVMCKFFEQQRCRFGTSCRLSHGVVVPLSSLKKFVPPTWEQALVGSTVWAVSDSKLGIWREAKLESWNDELRTGHVVFRDDGSSAKVGVEAITLSEYAEIDSEEESDLSSQQSDSSEFEEEGSQGLGFLESTALQRGIQTETAIFAKWESHTRGIASKMMANMGYREGMGLGTSGQGMLNPIPVKVLPAKQSLDHAVQGHESNEVGVNQGKKRSRGGKRKREKKFAAAARAAKEEEESRPDVFSLINNQLAMHGEALNSGSGKKQATKDSGKKKVDRRALIAYDDEVRELRIRVEKLEEMVNRNRKDKVVYEAAMRKLNETCKALADAEAAHASASNTVVSKEKEKRWLKF